LQKLCDDHWEYVESVIRNEYISELAITNGAGLDLDAYCKRLEFHYKSAMAHGFKHGVQWSAWQNLIVDKEAKIITIRSGQNIILDPEI
jgi:hypothetical protein